MRRFVYLPFQASAQGLLCDGVSVQSIVDRIGTPVYVYSAQAIRHAYQAIDTAFADYPHAIHYALKANSTLAIVRLLRSLGSRADANSGGEVAVACWFRSQGHRAHRRGQDAR
jgi:diaminopimelate decarboxylase